MPDSKSINIAIDSSELDKFCHKLLDRSHDIAKTHDALVTLETFISLFARPAHGTTEYNEIESVLHVVTDESRKKLLEKNTIELIAGLRQCDVVRIASIHTPLSRNGFYEILKVAIGKLSDDEIRLLMAWTQNWVKEVTSLAQEASGYPDAMDFNKSGLSIEEFQAMSDIDRVINS